MPRFDGNAVRRISKIVKGKERSPEAPAVPGRRVPHAVTVRPGAYAIITTTITARTGTSSPWTLGIGAGLLCSKEGQVITLTGEAITILSNLKTPVAASAADPVAIMWADGGWQIAVGDC